MNDGSTIPFEVAGLSVAAIFAMAGLLFQAWICFSIAYGIIALPLRRKERAGILLDLIETSIKDGRNPGEAIVSVAASRDPSLDWRLQLLAAHLEKGLPLQAALTSVPKLLPAQIREMLLVGLQTGRLPAVLPACRRLLDDAPSESRGAVNYLFLILMPPTYVYISLVLHVFVWPRFKEIGATMGITPSVFLSFTNSGFFQSLECLLILGWVGAILLLTASLAWPRPGTVFGGIRDRIFYSMPWRRKRMQRDFSTMLAILLDSGMPESEALELAGDCAANEIFRHRVDLARAALQQGLKLAQAVEMIDDSGEFRWRITQAVGREHSFSEAIVGWREALDAKAYQQEQATAQVVSTSLVLLNGAFVAIIALAAFGTILAIVNAGLLW